MNSRKLAVFVEGQTELIFVREFLKQWYNYDANTVGFDCYSVKEVLSTLDNRTFVDFHFAIMEVEAWLLGIPGFIGKNVGNSGNLQKAC